MSERLTQDVMDRLRTISDVDFYTYKAFHVNPNTKSIGQEYLEILAAGAEEAGLQTTKNYANFQKSLMADSLGVSKGANLSSIKSAEDTFDINYSTGSEARLRADWRQMREDFAARDQNYLDGKSGELGFDTQMEVIKTSLESVGLNGNIHPLYTPLSNDLPLMLVPVSELVSGRGCAPPSRRAGA